jgi:hypothetical protein
MSLTHLSIEDGEGDRAKGGGRVAAKTVLRLGDFAVEPPQ